MRYLLLSVLVVCAIGTISMVPVALAYTGSGIELEELLMEAVDNPPSASAQIGPNYGSAIEPEILGWQALGLLGLILMLIVPIALVILVVIAIKQYRRNKSS